MVRLVSDMDAGHTMDADSIKGLSISNDLAIVLVGDLKICRTRALVFDHGSVVRKGGHNGNIGYCWERRCLVREISEKVPLAYVKIGSLCVFEKRPSFLSPMSLRSRVWARRALLKRAAFSTAHGPALSSVTEADIAHFSKFLAPSSIISTLSPSPATSDELQPFNNDWIGRFHGRSTTVLKPKTTQEVSQILKWCNERRIGVVPQGGNTGLVGGSVPVNDEIVLSLANLNKVRSFDPVSGKYNLSTNCCFLTWTPIRCPGRRCWLYFAISYRLCHSA